VPGIQLMMVANSTPYLQTVKQGGWHLDQSLLVRKPHTSEGAPQQLTLLFGIWQLLWQLKIDVAHLLTAPSTDACYWLRYS
jgi:hypothetical protein